MSLNKNCPAQTIKEQPKAKRTIDRVMGGERFRITTDRMGFTYRFQKEDSTHWSFYINNLLVGVCNAGSFFPLGFAINLRMLGNVITHSVLCDDIRFYEELKGGALC